MIVILVAPLVGAWIETSRVRQQFTQERVAPLVGAWIETANRTQLKIWREVAPLVGAWIETQENNLQDEEFLSHPSWVRGLKLASYIRNTKSSSRTPRGCVD